MRKIFIEGNKT